MNNLRRKGADTGYRIARAARQLPRRLGRLGRHLGRFRWSSPRWYAETLTLLLETTGLPEVYETVADWTKWGTRPLRPEEERILREVFHDSLHYDRIRIDERAYVGPPQLRICYVSFYTINSYGPMREDILVHEAMHVWQYQRYGSVYIPRALAAQRSAAGYDYGGLKALRRAHDLDLGLDAFNFEQQADIIADYWRLKCGRPPRWLRPGEVAEPGVYEYFVGGVRREA